MLYTHQDFFKDVLHLLEPSLLDTEREWLQTVNISLKLTPPPMDLLQSMLAGGILQGNTEVERSPVMFTGDTSNSSVVRAMPLRVRIELYLSGLTFNMHNTAAALIHEIGHALAEYHGHTEGHSAYWAGVCQRLGINEVSYPDSEGRPDVGHEFGTALIDWTRPELFDAISALPAITNWAELDAKMSALGWSRKLPTTQPRGANEETSPAPQMER